MKRKHPYFIGFTLMLLAISLRAQQTDNRLTLWYHQPAGTNWDAALPVGNGHLGAMVLATLTANDCS